MVNTQSRVYTVSTRAANYGREDTCAQNDGFTETRACTSTCCPVRADTYSSFCCGLVVCAHGSLLRGDTVHHWILKLRTHLPAGRLWRRLRGLVGVHSGLRRRHPRPDLRDCHRAHLRRGGLPAREWLRGDPGGSSSNTCHQLPLPFLVFSLPLRAQTGLRDRPVRLPVRPRAVVRLHRRGPAALLHCALQGPVRAQPTPTNTISNAMSNAISNAISNATCIRCSGTARAPTPRLPPRCGRRSPSQATRLG